MNERDINVLMQDRCTRREAEKHLKNGTIVYDDPEEYFDSLKENDCYSGETIEKVRQGKCLDVSAVKYEGHEYLIVYVI